MLGALLKRSALLVSNDSGPVHIGCAVGTPVIVIFGRSDRGLSPQRWGPSGRKDVVLRKETDCEICYAHNCKVGFKCLESITAEEVLEAAGKILAEGK
jgi:heptosyltransferase-2